MLEQARENRSDYRADYHVTWPDGSLHWISAPGRVYGAANGDLIEIGGVTINIGQYRFFSMAPVGFNSDHA